MQALSAQKKPILIFLGVILILAAAYFSYTWFRTTQDPLSNADLSPQEQLSILKGRVGKLLTLPSDEDPTLATVSDKTKLKDQPFFAQAENGDRVLIYTKNDKAILYRSSINKVINVASLNLKNEASPTASIQPPATSSAQIKTFKVVIYNGTKTSGLAGKTETSLKSQLPGLQVIKKDNAKNDYDKTLLIPFGPNGQEAASEISKILPSSLNTLPEGEATPSGADLLVILGKDTK